jgi:hypothetical protein
MRPLIHFFRLYTINIINIIVKMSDSSLSPPLRCELSLPAIPQTPFVLPYGIHHPFNFAVLHQSLDFLSRILYYSLIVSSLLSRAHFSSNTVLGKAYTSTYDKMEQYYNMIKTQSFAIVVTICDPQFNFNIF